MPLCTKWNEISLSKSEFADPTCKTTPWGWSTDLFGIYANWQALIAQVVIAIVVVAIWRLGARPPAVVR